MFHKDDKLFNARAWPQAAALFVLGLCVVLVLVSGCGSSDKAELESAVKSVKSQIARGDEKPQKIVGEASPAGGQESRQSSHDAKSHTQTPGTAAQNVSARKAEDRRHAAIAIGEVQVESSKFNGSVRAQEAKIKDESPSAK